MNITWFAMPMGHGVWILTLSLSWFCLSARTHVLSFVVSIWLMILFHWSCALVRYQHMASIMFISNAAFTCYRNYRKYKFPNRKFDANGLSRCTKEIRK